jgi:hypothetical protein
MSAGPWVAEEGLGDAATRRLRVVPRMRNKAISEGFYVVGVQNAAAGCRTLQPPRNHPAVIARSPFAVSSVCFCFDARGHSTSRRRPCAAC